MSLVVYSIKELERFSGIKAHTIRIWEQRYDLLRPTRTDTNIRRYSEEDLKRLLNAATLNRLGYKISRIAGMTRGETIDVLNREASENLQEVHQLNILKISMLNFDEELFHSAIEADVQANGIKHAVVDVLGPFLVQIGMLWQTGVICPAHEHFVSNLIRQFLCESIADQEVPKTGDAPLVLFLPDGEMHELGLLYLHFLLRHEGMYSIYLGQAVPLNDLPQVQEKFPDAQFVSYLVDKDSTKIRKLLKRIKDVVDPEKESSMNVIGQIVKDSGLKNTSWARFYATSDDFLKYLQRNPV